MAKAFRQNVLIACLLGCARATLHPCKCAPPISHKNSPWSEERLEEAEKQVTKLEHHPGELLPRLDFITDQSLPIPAVVQSNN